MKRSGMFLSLLLIVASLLTLAPRTSDMLDNGWRVVTISDTFGRGRVSAITFWAMPPEDVPAVSRIPLYLSGGDWRLIRAPKGCTAAADAVVCEISAEQVRRKHLISIAVRSTAPDLSYSFVPPGT